MASQLLTVEKDENVICDSCGLHVSEGKRYWLSTPGSANARIEHDNCELYTNEYIRAEKLRSDQQEAINKLTESKNENL